jgi:hypothetical protein
MVVGPESCDPICRLVTRRARVFVAQDVYVRCFTFDACFIVVSNKGLGVYGGGDCILLYLMDQGL